MAVSRNEWKKAYEEQRNETVLVTAQKEQLQLNLNACKYYTDKTDKRLWWKHTWEKVKKPFTHLLSAFGGYVVGRQTAPR